MDGKLTLYVWDEATSMANPCLQADHHRGKMRTNWADWNRKKWLLKTAAELSTVPEEETALLIIRILPR